MCSESIFFSCLLCPLVLHDLANCRVIATRGFLDKVQDTAFQRHSVLWHIPGFSSDSALNWQKKKEIEEQKYTALSHGLKYTPAP